MQKLQFTHEQSLQLKFPIGCPVWYFPHRGMDEDGGYSILPGMVSGVFMDRKQESDNKVYYYQVVHNGKVVGEAIPGNDLSYAFRCPVVVDGDKDSESQIKAMVLQAKDMGDDMVYTIMFRVGGGMTAYREGIDSSRVRYRPNEVQELQSETVASSEEKVTVSAKVDGQESSPASNASCAPVTQSAKDLLSELRSTKSDPLSSNQITSPEDKVEKQSQATIRPSQSAKSMEISGSKRSATVLKPVSDAETLARQPEKKCKTSAKTEQYRSVDITLPLWLQRDKDSKIKLYAHLYGTPDNPHYKQMRKRANCNMCFERNEGTNKSMTMSIFHMNDNPYQADKNLTVARKMIEDILLEFKLPNLPRIQQDGSRGRLMYEIKKCHGKDPKQSTSKAVTQRNPFFKNKFCTMSLVELPSLYTVDGKIFHASYLKKKSILKKVRQTGSFMDFCGDNVGHPSQTYDHPVKYGDAYVLVTAKSGDWRAVDRAVDILNTEIRKHQKKCHCFLPE